VVSQTLLVFAIVSCNHTNQSVGPQKSFEALFSSPLNGCVSVFILRSSVVHGCEKLAWDTGAYLFRRNLLIDPKTTTVDNRIRLLILVVGTLVYCWPQNAREHPLTHSILAVGVLMVASDLVISYEQQQHHVLEFARYRLYG